MKKGLIIAFVFAILLCSSFVSAALEQPKVSLTLSQEISKCVKLPTLEGNGSSENLRNKCYYALAINMDNYSICSYMTPMWIGSLTQGYTREGCYAFFAEARGNPEICEKASEIDMRQNEISIGSCYGSYTYYTRKYSLSNSKIVNDSFCYSLRSQLKRDFCYQQLASLTAEDRFCEKVSTKNEAFRRPMQYLCYEVVAVKASSVDSCDKIPARKWWEMLLFVPDIQKECYTQLRERGLLE